ncbi:MAG TPA: hypothetical protein VKT29_10115, partial [Terriglobales bacterium]|nr:hypothetical protein [Terriglobales bacterium]
PVHLLLLDMVMPGKSGWEIAREMAPWCPQARVLFISGYGTGGQGEIRDSRIFRKPFTGGALARKVREVLDAATWPAEALLRSGKKLENSKRGPRRQSC